MILPAAGGTPPSFRVVPHDTNACAGSDVTFYVEATGDQPLDFSWLRNGLPLTTGVVSTATNSWVTVNNVQLPDFGAAFEVVVTNLSGSTNSPKAHLYVYMPPHVIQEPTNQSVAVGDTVVFSVMAGPMSLDYRWWFQGSPLTNGGSVSGADTATLTISNVQKTDAGYYRAAISNGCLVADSVPARCDVGPVTITIQPFSLTAPFQSSVQYAVGASGSPPLFYKWYRNDLVIAGATTSALNLTSVQRPEVGVYHAVVNNAHGAAASDRAHLQVELTFEGTLLAREEATDHPLSLTNALRTFVPVPTVVFHGAPLLFSTYDASAEQWETRCGVAPSHSMWLLYHAPRTEITKVSTEGSDFDTVLAVYNSDNPSNPTIIACDNNSGYDGLDSLLSFSATARTDYYIAVDGVGGARGTARVQVGEIIRNARFNPTNGTFRFEMAGPPWYTTMLRSATNPFTPTQAWVTNLTVPVTNQDWVKRYTNFNSVAPPPRFYRTVTRTNSSQ
jgi:hypothetical protein